jgi:thioredoxin-related protein
MKKVLFIIFIFITYSCSTDYNKNNNFDLIQIISQSLNEELKNEDKKILCLFISDNMCSACIEKEFINI